MSYIAILKINMDKLLFEIILYFIIRIKTAVFLHPVYIYNLISFNAKILCTRTLQYMLNFTEECEKLSP